MRDTMAGHYRLLPPAFPPRLQRRLKDVAFDSDCRQAVVLTFDGAVYVLDLKTGKTLQQLVTRGDRCFLTLNRLSSPPPS